MSTDTKNRVSCRASPGCAVLPRTTRTATSPRNRLPVKWNTCSILCWACCATLASRTFIWNCQPAVPLTSSSAPTGNGMTRLPCCGGWPRHPDWNWCLTRAVRPFTDRRYRYRHVTRSGAPGRCQPFSMTLTSRPGSGWNTQQPVMIHSAKFGSLERFFGVLIEHYAGAFPLWLSPVQVVGIPVAQEYEPYLHDIIDRLRRSGVRAELDTSDDRMQKKIRTHTKQKVPLL